MTFYRQEIDGLKLFIRLTPKSAFDKIIGVEDTADGKQHLSVRVRAIAENGKANKALIKFLAKEWRVPASSMNIVAGDISRLKQLKVMGDIEPILLYLKQFQ